jgi:hypothetical protein
VRDLYTHAPLFTDYAEADRALGLARNSAKAVAAGRLDPGRAGDWITSLSSGPFVATFVFFNVVAEAA